MSGSILVLDTHIWIWAMTGESERFSLECRAAIEQASLQGNLGVAAISVWELGMLEAKGRVRLAQPCLDWVRQALTAPGLRLLPLTPEIAVESSRLPGAIHGDPADRMIAATARICRGILVTGDRQLLDWGAQGFVSTLSP